MASKFGSALKRVLNTHSRPLKRKHHIVVLFLSGLQSFWGDGCSWRMSFNYSQPPMAKIDKKCGHCMEDGSNPITYENIQTLLGVGSAAVNDILHRQLGLRSVPSQWVPRDLAPSEKEAKVEWCAFRLQMEQLDISIWLRDKETIHFMAFPWWTNPNQGQTVQKCGKAISS